MRGLRSGLGWTSKDTVWCRVFTIQNGLGTPFRHGSTTNASFMILSGDLVMIATAMPLNLSQSLYRLANMSRRTASGPY
jgi:hypothetical protein